jgi:hypothetical protein
MSRAEWVALAIVVVVGVVIIASQLFGLTPSGEVRAAIIGAVVSIALAVGGWYAGFAAAIRAQRSLLLDQLRSAAVEQMGVALEEAHDAVARAFEDVNAVTNTAERAERGEEVDMAIERDRLGPVIRQLSHPLRWDSLLIQNVQLFPETYRVRKELRARVDGLRADVLTLEEEIQATVRAELTRKQMGARLFGVATKTSTRVIGHLELKLLFRDLRIHLHNSAFASLTGRKVADRDDSEATRERIALGAYGLLGIQRQAIVVSGDTTPGAPTPGDGG